MHKAAMNEMVRLAQDGKGQLALLTSSAHEEDIIVPSVLRGLLEGAGYTVEEKPGQHLIEVSVFDHEKNLVAKGMSHTAADALLQGVYAGMREELLEPKPARFAPGELKKIKITGASGADIEHVLTEMADKEAPDGTIKFDDLLKALRDAMIIQGSTEDDDE